MPNLDSPYMYNPFQIGGSAYSLGYVFHRNHFFISFLYKRKPTNLTWFAIVVFRINLKVIQKHCLIDQKSLPALKYLDVPGG